VTRRIRQGVLTPSMAVALVALVVALGGTTYAAIKLPARSVGAKQLKTRAVERAKIKPSAIDSSKIAANAVTGADVNEAALGAVPFANTANLANGITKITYKTAPGSVPPAPTIDNSAAAGNSAVCDPGQHVTGGGVSVANDDNMNVVRTHPDLNGTAWSAVVTNDDVGAGYGFTVYAICVPNPTTG
jgi:hypothetical protein